MVCAMWSDDVHLHVRCAMWTIISIKSLQLDNNNTLKINSVSDYSKDSKDSNIKKFLRPTDPVSFTSRRYDDWQEILKKNNNIFLFEKRSKKTFISALPGVSGSERPTPAVRPFHGQRDRGQREWPRDPDPGAGIRRPQIRGASDPHLWPFASERHLPGHRASTLPPSSR